MAIFLNILISLMEGFCMAYYFDICHMKNKYKIFKIRTCIITLLITFDAVLPSYIFPAYKSILISLAGLFLIFLIFYSRYIVDFLLSIGIVYFVILFSNQISALIFMKILKLNTLINVDSNLIIMLPMFLVELIILSLFLYNIKYFVILHNRIIQSKKASFIISILFQFILFFVVSIAEFNVNTNIYYRMLISTAYVILFIMNFYSFIKDYISICEKNLLLKNEQEVTQQFQAIQTKHSIQFSKLLTVAQLKQYDKMESQLKEFLQENSNDSIEITQNTHPIIVAGLQYFYEHNFYVIIDNQVDINNLKSIDMLEVLDILTNTSNYIKDSVDMNSVDNLKNKIKFIFKTRDYYDEIEFAYKFNCQGLKKINHNVSIRNYKKLKAFIEQKGGRIKIRKYKNMYIKLYLPKK